VSELARRFDVLRSTGLRAMPHLRAQRRMQAELAAFRPAVYAEIWTDAARACGAEAAERDGGTELSRGDRRVLVHEEIVPLDDEAAVALSFDKPEVHELLARDGIAVPEHVVVSRRDLGRGEALLPGVVKPARGTGVGAGITGGVRTAADLRRAALRAARYGDDLLVERELEGPVYRVLVLDGDVLDVIARRPPELTGDGRSTVLELVQAENARRIEARGHEALWALTIDPDLVLTLARAGLRLESVPDGGRTFAAKSTTNQNSARENESVRVDEALLEVSRRAAALVGLRLSGVDLIGDVVLEVNANPGLHHHYVVAGEPTRVAEPILERLLA
jgi:D-alanine-D-alanine ligase-like ATP-grasp enzyme